ncbi:MAG TPA: PilZ domain-containing protein [Candidatus Omnitrophota bacterium]|nr:PilZ domain-containing protein [Candidatus Omnitrophota bacterium]HPT07472.1 PilZ domain-containing protein [Candidatus Omnitrophota bacterium]
MGRVVRFLRQVSALNRRKCPRLELSKSLECVCSFAEDGKMLLRSGYIVNISEGGALVATRELKLYPQTTLTVRVSMPSQETVDVTGVILRAYRRSDGSEWYFSAMQFDPGNEVSIKKLLHLVSIEQ